MIQRNPSIEEDARFRDLRWTALVVSGVLAHAQEHDGGPDESQGLFDFQTAEPVRNSSTAGLNIGRLAISQPTPVLSDQLPSDPPTQPWNIGPSLEPHNGPLTSLQRMPPAHAMNNVIGTLQGALRSRGIELSRERAIQNLNQIAWAEARVNQLLLDAEEGDWTPPAESTDGKADDEDTEGN